MASTAATFNDSSDSDDSSDSSSCMIIDAVDGPDKELEKYYDPDTFECLSNDGVAIMSKESPDYDQVKGEFDAIFSMEDPSFDESNYKQFVTMAMTLNDPESIRKACSRYCTLYGYEDSIVLSWLYRELKNFAATGDKSIVEYMFENIFKKSLTEKYSRIIVYKLAHFTQYHPDRALIWSYIFDNFLYDFESPGKLVKLWASTLDTSTQENCEKLVEIYEKILAIPHADMDKTYIDFKVLVTKEAEKFKVDDWEFIQEDFEKAQSEADLMVAYENELDCATADNRATMFKLYLSEVGDKLDRKVRRMVFERMVAECSDASCWLMYLHYLRDRRYDESDDVEIEKVINRAIHLSDPHDEFFTYKMALLERSTSKEKAEIKQELTKTIEQALASSFGHPDMSTRVWLEYLTILRRLTDVKSAEEVEVLRKNFDLAWSSLSRQWGDAADNNGEILKFQARLEYRVLNDPDHGRELWNSVLGFGNNSQTAGIWLEFIDMEAGVNLGLARRLYKRALHTAELLDPETIANAWIRFERVHGDGDQLKNCQEHCDEVLKKFYALWKEQEEKTGPQETRGNTRERGRGGQSAAGPGKRDLKRKPEQQGKGERAPMHKKQKMEVVKGRAKGPPPPGAPNTSNAVEGGSSAEKVQQPNTENDHLKVFVSNLDYTLTEEDIRGAFTELTIRNVDLVVGPSGKSRGFCYLELGSEEEVKTALTLDRRPINERPAYISSCRRDKTQRTKKFNFEEGLEPKKLFVKGCGNSTQEELEALFKPFGAIKEVRMVFHKSGKSKGIAYIEFESETAAKTAVLKMDQFELNGQTLCVSISSPPAKPEKLPDKPKVQSLGNAKRMTGTSGDMKPRLSFIPSSVLKKHSA